MKHKQNNTKEHGFGMIGLILVFFTIVAVLVGGVYVYERLDPPEPEEAEAQQEVIINGETCTKNDQIELCMDYDIDSATWLDGLEIEAEVTNFSDSRYTYSYSSTCTDVSTIVNGSVLNAGEVCSVDLIEVAVDAGQTELLSAVIPLHVLRDGNNYIELRWAGLTSAKIVMEKPELTAEDKAILQACLGAQEYLPGCAILSISFEGWHRTYDDADVVLEQYGVSTIKQAQLAEQIFTVEVAVPGYEADEWIERLSNDNTIRIVTQQI